METRSLISRTLSFTKISPTSSANSNPYQQRRRRIASGTCLLALPGSRCHSFRQDNIGRAASDTYLITLLSFKLLRYLGTFNKSLYPSFVNQELEIFLILIHDKKISDINSLVRVLEMAVKRSPMLIMSEYVESEALTMLLINKHHAGLKVCAVKALGFENNTRANLDDLAILTGRVVISEDYGLRLDKVNINMLGSAKKMAKQLRRGIDQGGAAKRTLDT